MRRLQAQLQPGASALKNATQSKAATKSAAGKRAAATSSAKGAKSAKKPEKKTDDPSRIILAEFLAGAGADGALPAPTQAEIAFAGRSNVGKSSLINTLVGRNGLVRTSSTPGSTRQINLYEARAADGMVLHFIDLPGYGFNRRSKGEKAAWAKLIESYLSTRATLAVVVLLVDIRRGLEPDDVELIAFIESAQNVTRRPVQVVLVATKLDKEPRSRQKTALAQLAKTIGRPVIGFSSETGEGRRQLLATLRRAALGAPLEKERGDADADVEDVRGDGDADVDDAEPTLEQADQNG